MRRPEAAGCRDFRDCRDCHDCCDCRAGTLRRCGRTAACRPGFSGKSRTIRRFSIGISRAGVSVRGRVRLSSVGADAGRRGGTGRQPVHCSKGRECRESALRYEKRRSRSERSRSVVVVRIYPSSCGRRRSVRANYFFVFGASIMFIFLPSSLGIISTFATSSRSLAKRNSRISPCSLKTIERPRKKT